MLPRKKKTDKKKPRRNADDRKTWIAKLDKVFSLYIRMRDSKPYRYGSFRCISCGDSFPIAMADAGHFVSRNCMPLRWNPANVHAECQSCNRFHGDHLLAYRRNLIDKLGRQAFECSSLADKDISDGQKLRLIRQMGEQKVSQLEAMKYQTKKWEVDELKQLYMYYAALVLEMKNEM